MRFKQALSRKLAAALSAVMILSTIAPTSVPVLAAAPDDVLVDSNVEYDLQDAGSEDVLLDSAESSLAEETDTLEVAGEELLAPETASDEVLVDSAEEVLSEETGIEPVETVEAPESVSEEREEWSGNFTFNVVSNNIIKEVTLKYVSFNDAEGSASAEVTLPPIAITEDGSYTVAIVSANTSANSVANGYASLIVSDFTAKALGNSDGDYDSKFTLSVNGEVGTQNEGDYDGSTNQAEEVSVNLVPGTKTVEVRADRTAYDGTLVLNTVSNDIISEITYSFDGVDQPVVNVSANKLQKEVVFKNKKTVAVKASEILNSSATIEYGADKGYTLSVNATGGKKENLTVTGTNTYSDTKQYNLKELAFTNGGNFTVDVTADPTKDYNKKGTLKVKVSSSNSINGQIVSINQVNVQLDEYAIEFNKSTGKFDTATYRGVASVNTITAQDQVIELPYEYAKTAKIKVVTDQGNTNDRFEYKIDGIKDTVKKGTAGTLTLNASGTQEVNIKPVQVSFDPVVEFNPVSANILKSFKVYATDNKDNETYQTVLTDADGHLQSKTFENVKKITFKYAGFDASAASSEAIARGWVYRIEFDGKVQKTFIPVVDETAFDIEVKDGKLPEKIKVSAVPNVKVTLSANDANRNKEDIWAPLCGYIAENGQSGTATSVVSNVASCFYVEPGKVVSVNNVFAPSAEKKGYLFPYVVDATEVTLGDGTFTLGTMEEGQDKTFAVDVREFALFNPDKFETGSALGYTKVGNGTLSVDGLVGSAFIKETNEKSTCSNNQVFKYVNAGTPLRVQFKLDGTDEFQYNVERVTYKYWAGNGYKTVVNKNVPMDGKHFIVPVSANFAKATLLKDGKIDLEVKTNEISVSYNLAFTENNSGSLTPTITNGGVTIADAFSDSPKKVNYGSNLVVKVEPKAGFQLVSVNIIEADKNATISSTMSENKVTNITDAKKLAEFTGKGYSHKMGKETKFEFTTEKVYAADVVYADTKEVTVKSGKYQVNHQRPVKVTYKNGSDVLADGKFSYDILVANKSVSGNEGIVKTAGKAEFTIDGTKGELAGKTIVIKLWAGDGTAKDATLKTLTLVMDAADTGVKFKNEEEKLPIGGTAAIAATVKGNINAVAEVKEGEIAGLKVEFANNKLTVKSTAKTPKGTYTVNIIDKDATPKIIYGTVKITLHYDEVTNAEKPVVKVTNTTNRRIFLSLKANKLNANLDGLYYKVVVKTEQYKKSYFLSSRTMYVPITETSCYVDMFKDGLEPAQLYDGDPDAKFSVTVQVVQGHSAVKTNENAYANPRKIITGLTEVAKGAEAKESDVKGKEGKVFATKVTLKKVTKGNPYTNMSAANPYVISIAYDKNCQVQQLDHVEIINQNGENVANNWNYDCDDYTIKIKPYADGTVDRMLKAGKYTIKAYALEPSSVPVVGQIKINVKQAIHGLSVEGASDVIYKTPGQKATADFTAYDTTFAGKVSTTKKVDWFIVDATDTTKVLDFGKNITLKNGKLTIKKDYTIPKEGVTFKIKVKAKDYASNTVTADTSKAVTLKGAPELALNLAFTPIHAGGVLFDKTDLKDLESSYTVKELFGDYSEEDEKYEYVTYVTAYDKAKTANAKGHFVPATFKVSGSAKLIGTFIGGETGEGDTHPIIAKIGLNKPGKFKITVTPNDGSGKAREIKNKEITVTSTGTLGYTFTAGGVELGKAVDENAGKSVSVNNYQAEGDSIRLFVSGYYKDAESNYTNTFLNHKISVKGGKFVKTFKTGACDIYQITPNDTKTIVTLTNADTKAKFDVTINNYAIGAKNVKTQVTATNNNGVKADAKGTIYSYLNFAGGAVAYGSAGVSYNKVTYTLSKGTGTHVLVSVTKDDLTNLMPIVYDAANEIYAGPIEASIAKVGTRINQDTYAIALESNKFVVDYAYTSYLTDTDPKTLAWSAAGQFNIKPGTYKISVTPAKKDGDKYVATGKAVNVNVSAKKAPKANVKPKTSVDWDNTKHQGTVPAGNYKNYITSGKVNFIGVLNTNTKGVYNNFKWDGGTTGNFTILDPDHAAVDNKTNTTGTLEFKGAKAIDAKAKSELQGWVTYRYQALDGTTETQNIKVTIKPAKGATEVK